MSKSILQKDKECYLTGDTQCLHKHHVFGGANRKHSEHYGLWVYLRADWHNMSNYGVHNDVTLDVELKQTAQRAFEKKYSHELFMSVFGKNYL